MSQKLYDPILSKEKITIGYGVPVIVCGWTLTRLITKKFLPSQYAAIGNLYSATRGIEPLIRNLLWNPRFNYVLCLAQTKEDEVAKAHEVLSHFFLAGFEETEQGALIKSDINCYLDPAIPYDALEGLRRRIVFHLTDNITELSNLVNLYKNKVSKPTKNKDKPRIYYEPKQYPVTQTKTDVFPGQLYGNRVEASVIAQAWVKLLHRIRKVGRITTGNHGKIQELIDTITVINNEPENFYFPDPNYLPTDPQSIQAYLPQVLNDNNGDPSDSYTYGQRLRSWFGMDQIEEVIDHLASKPDSTRAVMNIWDSSGIKDTGYKFNPPDFLEHESDIESTNPPCLNHIWVRIVEGKLTLTATFRSHDMYSAWVPNTMALSALQRTIMYSINAEGNHNFKMGPLIIISQSSHIYDDSWKEADVVVKDNYNRIIRNGNYDDPIGNFLVEVVDRKIVITLVHPETGATLRSYSNKYPSPLLEQVCRDFPQIKPSHAAYLGKEAQHASHCISYEETYIQGDV